jgi:hypothetical protein
MSFDELYKRVQSKNPKISSKWIRDQVIDLTSIATVREQWTGAMDDTDMRGFWIEGPMRPPIALEENEALVVLARGLSKPWRRFVYTKELMHAFDEEGEKTDSAEKLDQQVERFSDPTVEKTPQYKSEVKAFWRALAVLCPEDYRLEQVKGVEAGDITLSMVATRLVIPERYIRHLFRGNFLEIVQALK